MSNQKPPLPNEFNKMPLAGHRENTKSGVSFIYMRKDRRPDNYDEFGNADLILNETHPDHLTVNQIIKITESDREIAKRNTQVPDEYLESGAYRIGNGPIMRSIKRKQLSLFEEK